MRALTLPLLALSLFLAGSPAQALSPDTTDARAIMDAVENRDDSSSSRFRLGITITDAAGRQRTRAVQVRSLKFEGGSKQLLLFEEPADLRGAGFLSVDYHSAGQTDDQWLYLPSVGRTTRIASADKSSSFMGTDLSYADMTRKDPSAYDYQLLDGNAEVDGTPCWQILATPRTAQEQQETGYLKSEVWVSKDKLLPLQVKAWVIEGKRIKYTKLGDIRQVDGSWVAHQVVVNTVKNGALESSSTLVTSGLVLNAGDISEADFTEQRLERGL